MLKYSQLDRKVYQSITVLITIIVSVVPFLIILFHPDHSPFFVSNVLMWLLVATLAGSAFLRFRYAVLQVVLICLGITLLSAVHMDISMGVLIRPFIQYTVLSFLILSLRYYLLIQEQSRLAQEKALYEEAKRNEVTLQRQKQQLEILRDVGLELTSELDISALIESIIVHSVRILEADIGSLWLIDAEEGVLRLMTNYRGRFPVGMTMMRGEGITGKVWANGKSMFVNDYFTWTGRLDVFDKTLSQSVAAVPVINQGKVQGVINIGARTKNFFNPEDLELLELLAAQAAVALANAHLHTQLKQHSAELERSNRELQDFAYIASHDLQEPLRKIQAFSDRLQRQYGNSLDEKGMDYLVRLRDAASRMQNLIIDLLAFSRITTKAEPLVPVDLNKILVYVMNDLEIRRQETNAEIHLDTLPVLPADETQMGQLFQNLLSNALKFTIPGQTPVIHIGCEPISENGMLQKYVITVTDNGIGFEEKYIDRIFGVFQRLHSRQEYDGTGVGLALCEKIVMRHQGTITAQSQPGKGTTFIITLPAQ